MGWLNGGACYDLSVCSVSYERDFHEVSLGSYIPWRGRYGLRARSDVLYEHKLMIPARVLRVFSIMPKYLRFNLLLACLCLSLAGVRGATVPLVVDSGASKIDVAVHATMDSFVGTLSAYTVGIDVDGTTRMPTNATLRFRFADLKTGKSGRDSKMLSWIEGGTWPEGTFVLSSLTRSEGEAFVAVGTLTMHGKSVELSFPVHVATSGQRVVIDGSAKINTPDFGLPIIRMFGLLKVDPSVVVTFHLEGRHD